MILIKSLFRAVRAMLGQFGLQIRDAMLIVADAEATSAPPNTLDFHTLMRRSSDEFAIGPTSLFVGALCHEPPQQGYSDLD